MSPPRSYLYHPYFVQHFPFVAQSGCCNRHIEAAAALIRYKARRSYEYDRQEGNSCVVILTTIEVRPRYDANLTFLLGQLVSWVSNLAVSRRPQVSSTHIPQILLRAPRGAQHTVRQLPAPLAPARSAPARSNTGRSGASPLDSSLVPGPPRLCAGCPDQY